MTRPPISSGVARVKDSGCGAEDEEAADAARVVRDFTATGAGGTSTRYS